MRMQISCHAMPLQCDSAILENLEYILHIILGINAMVLCANAVLDVTEKCP